MLHEHWHSLVQGKSALKYFHLLQTFLHLHLISLKHVSAASGYDIQFGTHSREILSQPQEFGVDISGLGMQLFHHIPVCNTAFIIWRYNASCVSGMFSSLQLFWQNISRRPSFTFSWVLTRLYKTIINLSVVLNCKRLIIIYWKEIIHYPKKWFFDYRKKFSRFP